MKKITVLKSSAVVGAALLIGVSGCKEDGASVVSGSAVELKNRSVTPALVKNVMSGVDVYSLLSSDDVLEQSKDYVFGGSADGSGLLKTADGFYFVVNNEDNWSVSRITLDKTFKPLKGEYILNSDNGHYRLCSATLATPEIHGFGPTFLTCGESNVESQIHALNPITKADNIQTAFGHWSAENALPLPKEAYSGKTVVLITDDDSGNNGGQVAMYIGNSGDLENGNLYVLARTDNNTKETDMLTNQSYQVEFRQIQNQKNMTGAEINAKTAELMAMKFGRVEDIDYRKGSGKEREVYFTVTGQDFTGANADHSRTRKGRIYRLTLDANNPLKGTLECILDGDDKGGIANQFQNPDNICVTSNYVYIQEDANGYGDETHDAYIYQYDIAAKTLKVVMELDHRRDKSDKDYYNKNEKTAQPELSKFGAWEYGALIDVSDQTGIPNTFMLSIQPHTWVGEKYKNPDKGASRTSEWQASQILVLKGLPR